MKKRLFSVPYNGDDPDTYLNMLNKYKDNVENIFMGLSDIIGNFHDINHNSAEAITHINNSYKFIQKARQAGYKILITINRVIYLETNNELERIIKEKIVPIIKKYDINGCICTNYFMASKLHEYIPELEINTSCNNFQWTSRSMKLWQEKCGATVFNPPREGIRTPWLLKELKQQGFKTKYLINEACLYGCPEMHNHCANLYVVNNPHPNCSRNDPSSIFKGTYVLPSWLNDLDEYIDIYKITGRHSTTSQIDKILFYYTNNIDPEYLDVILMNINNALYEQSIQNIRIKCSDVPKKVLTCECKECDTTCTLCRDTINRIIKEAEEGKR